MALRINWQRVNSYEEAKNFFAVVYLHEWDGQPFYWGKVEESVFGGNPRNVSGRRRNGRYNPGYRHWIEGCLQHGARLYFGEVVEREDYSLDQIEAFLITRYPSKMNKQELIVLSIQHIDHDGDVPLSIRSSV